MPNKMGADLWLYELTRRFYVSLMRGNYLPTTESPRLLAVSRKDYRHSPSL